MAQTILCPYCGLAEDARSERCGACGGFFDDLSRRVTQQHMGPWFVRDPQQPFRPGCTYEILVKQIQRGKITEQTPLRGPTTRQFWTMAKQVPGVGHLLGFCPSCGAATKPDAKQCASCSTPFVEPSDREAMGLSPVDPGLWEEVEKARAAEAAAAAVPPPITSKPATTAGMPVAAQTRAAGASGSASLTTASPTHAKQSGIRPPTASGIPRSAAPAVATVKSSSGIKSPGNDATARAAASATPGGSARATVLNTASNAPLKHTSRAAALGSARGETLPWMTGTAAATQPVTPTTTAGMNKWVVLFIALNVVLVVAIVLIIVSQYMKDATPSESPSSAPHGTTPKDPTVPEMPPTHKESPTTPPAAAVEPKPEPLKSEPVPPSTPIAVTPPPTAPITPPASPTASGNASFFGIAVNPSGITEEQAAAFNKQMAAANDLYKADRLDEAKAILLKIKSELGAAAKGTGIDEAVKNVSDKIHKKELDQFFNPAPR